MVNIKFLRLLFLFMIFYSCVTPVKSEIALAFKPSNTWGGRVGKEVIHTQSWASLAGQSTSECSECFLSHAELKRFWDYWEIPNPIPSMDFENEFAFVFMSHGGPVLMELSVEKDGNLAARYAVTPTWGPKLNYVITSVKRQGIRSFNGQSIQ